MKMTHEMVLLLEEAAVLAKVYWSKEKKIQAIKEVRSVTGIGLKAAKDFVENLCQNNMSFTEAVCLVPAYQTKVAQTIADNLHEMYFSGYLVRPVADGYSVSYETEENSDFAANASIYCGFVPEDIANAAVSAFPTKVDSDEMNAIVGAVAKAGAKAKNIGSFTFEFEQPEVGKKVVYSRLYDADFMYQPVAGSSPGSCYLVVALSYDLKMACRIKNDRVSIRIEGSRLATNAFRDMLSEVGFSTVSEKYASFHVDAPSPILQMKTLGATILSLSSQWDSPLPDLGEIYGKGQ